MSALDTPPAHEGVAKPYDQVILFGDSITQMSYNQEVGFGFGAQLQEGISISRGPNQSETSNFSR